MNKRMLALLLALMLIVGATVGGTIAWLTSKTDAVVNTFTVGDINITLQEHPVNPDGTVDEKADPVTKVAYNYVPGDTLGKDPWVTVEKDSEACYLFVKVVETNNTIDGLTGKIVNYTVDTTVWKAVAGHPGYWYCEIGAEAAKEGTTRSILASQNTSAEWTEKDNVTINENVTKEMVEDINTNKPLLTFTAAAVQKDNIADVATAWAQLPAAFTT